MAKPVIDAQGRRRRGRPPGAPESIRNKRVVTLLTDSEFEKLTNLAAENGQSVSALVHELIAKHLKRRR